MAKKMTLTDTHKKHMVRCQKWPNLVDFTIGSSKVKIPENKSQKSDLKTTTNENKKDFLMDIVKVTQRYYDGSELLERQRDDVEEKNSQLNQGREEEEDVLNSKVDNCLTGVASCIVSMM